MVLSMVLGVENFSSFMYELLLTGKTGEIVKPGKELNELVAEKVMGWRCVATAGYGPLSWVPPSYQPGRVNQSMNIMSVPDFSGSIAEAWKVVEKMREPGALSTFFHLEDDGAVWEAGWGDWPDGRNFSFEISERAASAPHAICLAALKAAGIKL